MVLKASVGGGKDSSQKPRSRAGTSEIPFLLPPQLLNSSPKGEDTFAKATIANADLLVAANNAEEEMSHVAVLIQQIGDAAKHARCGS